MSIELPPLALRPKIIGLGHACDVAYQIRRITHDETAYFYDWLMTPQHSCNLMDIDWDNFLTSKNWNLSDDARGVIDRATGIEFRHQFKWISNSSDLIDEALVEGQLAQAKEKFLYLRNVTLTAIRSKNYVYLIRRDSFESPDDAMLAAEKILSAYLKLNPLIRLIIVSPHAVSETFTPYYIFVKSKLRPATDTGWWCGEDNSWNRVLNLAHNWFQFHKFKDIQI